MDDAPALPLMPDGSLPPTALLLRWLERTRSRRVRLASLPPGNHVLPDLLRLGGVAELLLEHAPLPAIRWEGAGGGRILLRDAAAPDQAAAEDAPLHCGALPAHHGWSGWDASALCGLLDLARLEDASAAVGAGDGASWEALLAAGGWDRPLAIPPVSALAGRGGDGFGAWNPLALQRRCLVALPATRATAPWSLRDDQGGRHAVQPTEGALGPTWLVQLPLGPLASTGLVPDDEPAASCHWDVTPRLIDNGRVRAELDDLGQVVRLCWDGVFAELAGPACAASVDGIALAGAATVTVLEDGPVRARIAVRRESPEGRLDLVYSLHADEDHLRVHATWSGAGECWIDHPTAQRASELHAAIEGARFAQAQAADCLRPPMDPTPGLRWAALADSSGRGMAIAGGRPLTVHAYAGHLRVLAAPTCAWAMAAPRRPPGSGGLGQLAEHLAMPGRPLPAGIPVSRPFRLADLGGLVPLWVGRPAGWAGELLLAEQHGARTRAWLLPTAPPGAGAECWKVDAAGERLAPCPGSPDGDGWQIDAAPGEVMLVRWKGS